MAAKKPQSQANRSSAVRSRPSDRAWQARSQSSPAAAAASAMPLRAALAAEGCSVVITGRDAASSARARRNSAIAPKKHLRNRAPRSSPMVCDVRDPDSVASLFAMVKQRFGKLDVLVNNAGISSAAESPSRKPRWNCGAT